jgi:hypothetical protein
MASTVSPQVLVARRDMTLLSIQVNGGKAVVREGVACGRCTVIPDGRMLR